MLQRLAPSAARTAIARRRARQPQVRNIRARDQKNAHDGSNQEIQAGAIIADRCFEQRPHLHSTSGIALRIFFLQIDGNRIEIARRLRDRQTRFESTKSRPTLMIVALHHPWFLRNFAERQKDVRIPAKLKFGWEHSYDLALQAIDQHAPPKDRGRSGEIMSPEILADQCDIRRTRCVVYWA